MMRELCPSYRCFDVPPLLSFSVRIVFRFVVFAWILGFTSADATVLVNSLQDVATPAPGQMTLRLALESAASGESIVFDPSLDGCTIELTIVGEEHSTLVGELMGGSNAPSGYISYLIGYFERDYGRSALYAQKDVVLDASALPLGITLKWGGGDADPARVMAVYGNLSMNKVSITGGRSVSVALSPDPGDEYPQQSTRARGGGLAVWGVAHLEHCRLYDNACSQDLNMSVRDSREGGVFGGALYADIVEISDCVISGNTLSGAGVSGGGVFSVGGRDVVTKWVSFLERSSITGNSISGIFAYGGGVYSDGGGIGVLKHLQLVNCTVAQNQVNFAAPVSFGYWRGGGIYMSNGYLLLDSCTVVNNEVAGVPRTDALGKANLAGGVAATIGNAHAVERMTIGHCILAGNWVHPFGGTSYNEDVFTGSLFEFLSKGYNRIGRINFDQMLVPVGVRYWYSLCRKHWPKTGDQDGVVLADVLDLTNGVVRSADILSVGVEAAGPAVLRYTPQGDAVDQVPASSYSLSKTQAEYWPLTGGTDNFLEILLGRVEDEYSLTNFASNFTTSFESFLSSVDSDGVETNGVQPYTDPNGDPILTLEPTLWYGPVATWPSFLYNYPYMEFWHQLDDALRMENIPGMGQELLGDDAWLALFEEGVLAENPLLYLHIWTSNYSVQPTGSDQAAAARPVNSLGDIGAVERQPPSDEALAGTDTDADGMIDALDEDDDNDGLSDAGELAIGTDAKKSDTDGDGTTDREEVLAGTDPLMKTSLFRMEDLTFADSNVLIHWSSASNRSYSLWVSTNLMTAGWECIGSEIAATVPVNDHSITNAFDSYLFKVEVE